MNQPKHIGLLFGSFNPIHVGHLMLANYMRETIQMDEVWLIISPQNPFKESDELIDRSLRLEMAQMALKGQMNYRVSDIEFYLPLPSYTINTLEQLTQYHPECVFSIIMGSDNVMSIDRWKSYDKIIGSHKLFVYPRPGSDLSHIPVHTNIISVKAPQIEISSTFIRQSFREGKDMRFFMPEDVYHFIRQKKLYLK